MHLYPQISADELIMRNWDAAIRGACQGATASQLRIKLDFFEGHTEELSEASHAITA